jgi:hypothetical protein
VKRKRVLVDKRWLYITKDSPIYQCPSFLYAYKDGGLVLKDAPGKQHCINGVVFRVGPYTVWFTFRRFSW